MDKLISDHAQVEISERVQDFLRALIIPTWQSEPHNQQQNPAEVGDVMMSTSLTAFEYLMSANKLYGTTAAAAATGLGAGGAGFSFFSGGLGMTEFHVIFRLVLPRLQHHSRTYTHT